jgi:hypothetical protein
MRKVVIATTLVMVMAGSAIAQTGRSSTSSSGKQLPWPAPTGHRQPRLDQVPDQSSSEDAVKREDAQLDRKLKSICRGC